MRALRSRALLLAVAIAGLWAAQSLAPAHAPGPGLGAVDVEAERAVREAVRQLADAAHARGREADPLAQRARESARG